MAAEIERKFRLTAPPDWLSGCERARIEQGYIAIEGDGGAEVRLRLRDGETWLTVKHGSGLTRSEEEVELERGQFEALWAVTEGRRIVKTRYLVPHDSLTIEIDVFEGALAGIVLAEVEFDSEAASENFDPPDWLGEEVTGDDRYANETLAVSGRPQS